MHRHRKEFDRTPPKTSPSRSIKFAPSKNSGFTLIELLVVISIIALLSTIVLAVVQDTRAQALNTAKNDIVLQYIQALELYSSDNNGLYPDSKITGEAYDFSCLGFEEDEGCFKNNGSNIHTGLNSLNTSLEKYYPGLPKANEIITTVGTAEWTGIRYIKYNDKYKLIWYLNGDTECVRGANAASSPDKTLCTYPEA